jgi:hypothetical protein
MTKDPTIREREIQSEMLAMARDLEVIAARSVLLLREVETLPGYLAALEADRAGRAPHSVAWELAGPLDEARRTARDLSAFMHAASVATEEALKRAAGESA